MRPPLDDSGSSFSEDVSESDEDIDYSASSVDGNGSSSDDDEIPASSHHKQNPFFLWVPYQLERGNGKGHIDLDLSEEVSDKTDLQLVRDEIEEDETVDMTDRTAAKKEEKALWKLLRKSTEVTFEGEEPALKRKRKVKGEGEVERRRRPKKKKVEDDSNRDDKRCKFKSARYVNSDSGEESDCVDLERTDGKEEKGTMTVK